jgi:hypothetical protein
MKIIRVLRQGDAVSYLTYEDTLDSSDRVIEGAPSLEELADLCDLQAEQRNNHDYVGVHRLLAVLLYRQIGREAATTAIFWIAEHGGLDGMNGVGGATRHFDSAFSELGVPDPWKVWKLV